MRKSEIIAKKLEAKFEGELKSYGYKWFQDRFGVGFYHPDSLFFVRENNCWLDYGFAIKCMAEDFSLPDDLRAIRAIQSKEIINEEDCDEFLSQALKKYEDYVYQIPLKFKVKKVFKEILEIASTQIREPSRTGVTETCILKTENYLVNIQRNYWTQKLSAYIKIEGSDQLIPIAKFAEKLELEVPLGGVTTEQQNRYLNFVMKATTELQAIDSIMEFHKYLSIKLESCDD